MKIIIPNYELLEKLLSVVRMVPKNSSVRFVADNNLLSMYGESSSGYVKGVVLNIQVIESGEVAAPPSLIPALKNANYPVEMTKTHYLNLMYKGSGPRGINLNMMTDPEMIGISTIQPEWVEEVEELSKLTYLMQDLDQRVWITDEAIAVGNSFRFGVFRKSLGLGNKVLFAKDLYSNFDFREGIYLDIKGNKIFFGNRGYYISLSLIDTTLPDRLVELINSEPTYEFLCVVSRNELRRGLSNAKMLSKNDDGVPLVIQFSKKNIQLIPTGNTLGEGNPEIGAIEMNGELTIKVNVDYISKAVESCTGENLVISNLQMGNLNLLAIRDNKILHYIVPMY